MFVMVMVVMPRVVAVLARALDRGARGAGRADGVGLLLVVEREPGLRKQVEQRDQEMGPTAHACHTMCFIRPRVKEGVE